MNPSATWHASVQGPSENQRNRPETPLSDDGFSFKSSNNFEFTDGLSTDGLEIYDLGNQLAQPSFFDDGDASRYREQNVRSAPAAFPGGHQMRPAIANSSTIFEDDNSSQQSMHRMQISETHAVGEDLNWIFSAVHSAQQQSKAVPQSTAFLKNLSKSASGATVDLPFENFLLRMVDNDLQHHRDFDFLDTEPEEEEEEELVGDFDTAGDNENDDEGEEEEEVQVETFWTASKKYSSKHQRHAAALTRGSLLALIDDTKHNTSSKHTPSAGADFFQAAAAAAAAVGLEDLAAKLTPKPPKSASGKEFFTLSPDNSRPESPYVAATRASSSGKEAHKQEILAGVPVDWSGAFASSDEIGFDPSKVHRSKSMGPIKPKPISGMSVKNPPPALKIEDFLKDIVEVEEEDDGLPFKTTVPGRRRSFAGLPTDFENSLHTSPKVVDKKGNVKYFSYLYKSQKKRVKSPVLSKNEDGLAMAVEQTRASNAAAGVVTDPFASNRSERRSSPPNLLRTNSTDSEEAGDAPIMGAAGITKPKPVVDLGERRYSSPSVDGPVWGHIPNLSTKPAHISIESRRGSPLVRSAPTSKPNSRASTPIIVGLIKKFSFEGEYLKSPFLHHMTKDKHLEKYGDAQRRQRQAAKKAGDDSPAASPTYRNESMKSTTVRSPKSPAVTPSSNKRASSKMSKSTGSLPEASSSSVINTGFNTQVDKPKNPFLRQNSWEKDPDGMAFNETIQQRRPFAHLGSFDKSVASTISDLDNGSVTTKARGSLSRQNTAEFDRSDLPGSFSRQGSFAADNFASSDNSALSKPGSLSRQSSLGRGGLLSRQPSSQLTSTAERDDSRPPPSLSRQNSYSAPQTLPPLATGPQVATTEQQAWNNSINSVLVAPTPLKLSRPADVFSQSYASATPGPGAKDGNLSARMEADEFGSPRSGQSPVSRGSSSKIISPGKSQQHSSTPHTSTSILRSSLGGAARKKNSISPLRAGDIIAGLSISTADNDSRPNSRQPGTNSVTFAATVLHTNAAATGSASPTPAVSEAIMQYVPSERRGSLSGEGMEEIMKGVPKSTIIQRRKSSAGLLNNMVATGNIDMLVSARRKSFISVGTETLGIAAETNGGFSPTNNSTKSEFSNPLMEDYYDAEEGLQDTGIIIANLHADPLYRILREEMERKETAAAAQLGVVADRNQPQSGMMQGQQSRPQSSSQPPKKLPPRPIRSANGLSNYKSRILSQIINPPDLKVLSTFQSLPPAAWVTCRVVYFLVLSFYETVPRVGKHYEYRAALNMESLWVALEAQRTEYKLSMEHLELEYSWPLLQALLAKFPVLFTKLLHAIEHGHTTDSSSFKSSTFFDAFPPTKLIYLRDLIKQGMGLFQSAELVHVIPVAAQLCDWCKRIIAQVYASCITRLRATQSNIKKVASVLHSTVAPYISVEDSLAGTTAATASGAHASVFAPQAPAVLPPNFKFALAIEDALDEGALFAMHSQDSFSAFENSQTVLVNLSHTLEKGLNLVKPSDHLDLLLVPPNISDICAQLSLYGGGVLDEFNGSIMAGSQEEVEGSLKRIQSDWLLTKHNYERHLQQYAASPLHRVVLLPPPPSDFSTQGSASSYSIAGGGSSCKEQQENELQALLDNFYREQDAGRLHALSKQDSAKAKAPLFPLQAQGVHPIVEHSLTAVALPISPSAAAKVSPQADIVIARLRNGKPGFVKEGFGTGINNRFVIPFLLFIYEEKLCSYFGIVLYFIQFVAALFAGAD